MLTADTSVAVRGVCLHLSSTSHTYCLPIRVVFPNETARSTANLRAASIRSLLREIGSLLVIGKEAMSSFRCFYKASSIRSQGCGNLLATSRQ